MEWQRRSLTQMDRGVDSSREPKRRYKAVGEQSSEDVGNREVLEEPVQGGHKFLKEVN